ncbi:2-hydroxyacid dehydrogenase [Allostreptomyces psammosilenae]|uniref:Phosphoglycerate dehydrogenase-like enzyme n=1 Tax=Allostreptomyces psammosilenae TaxID=1892865 RepID=A0A852ZWF8_9ACTN|nr:2-hydroxyacid dehydrogenase [Allostreptomyces psammosilenae]NYI06549.1 phosphoglycerate dehydrogenase-like enzyme [Allostreptomyces psammosilenae]
MAELTHSSARVVWSPFSAEEIGDLPADVDVRVWDGKGPLPGPTEDVEFFVLPYLRARAGMLLTPDMPKLRVAQSLTAGVDNLLDLLPSGVTLCNARGVHDAGTAELALTLTLASLRGIPDFVRAQPSGQWLFGFRPALADKVVLLVGYGSIGQAVEDRLLPFECDVIRVARTARQGPRGPVHALEELPRLLPRADVVIVIVPLTDETRGLVDAEFLGRMKDGALMVNVARGPVVVTDDLLGAVGEGRLLAALDVTDPEPLPPEHPLWRAPGTLISPHVGGANSAFQPRALRLVRRQLARWLGGEPLENVVAGPA